MRVATLSLMLLTSALTASARGADPDTLLAAVRAQKTGLWRLASPVFDNPAMNQWRLPSGVTSVDVAYNTRSDSRTVNAAAGKSAFAWSGGAETYTRYRQSVLAGSARYTNGRRHDVRWCETSDPELVYPYVLADSVGGDMSTESYEFSGAYSQQSERWTWGGRLAYRATLEYRDVDPRPRNVVGCLDAAVGGGVRLVGDYSLGLDVDFRRYSQSNDVEFKSEMGVDKIFHLTGLLSHYVRFGGSGISVHYRGYRYGAGAAFYPKSGSGGFARLHMSRFKFDNILTELNKLPLASATHKALEARLGWLAPGSSVNWGAYADLTTCRRHGRENIFGDATSGVYPVIGGLEMYADNATAVTIAGRAGVKFGGNEVSLELAPTYTYRSTVYLSPRQYQRVQAFVPRGRVEYSLLTSRGWLVIAKGRVAISTPFGCQYSVATSDAELHQLAEISQREYDLASHSCTQWMLSAGVSRKLTRRLGLQIEAVWNGAALYDHTHSNSLGLSIGLIL